MVLGKALYFATAMPLAGSAVGLLVESHEGRPTKVEGNPNHPANKSGAADAFAQASVLSLYDPYPSRSVMYRGRIRSWAHARPAPPGPCAPHPTRTPPPHSAFPPPPAPPLPPA